MKIGPAFLQTLTTQVIQTAASVAAGIVIARGLGPVGQGRYALFVAVVGLLSTVAGVGQFEGHVLVSAGEPSRGRLLLVRSLLQSVAAIVILGLTRSVWRPGVGLEGEGGLTRLLILVFLCEVLALLFRGINLGQHNVTAYNVATLVHRITFLATVGTLAVFHALHVDTVLAAWLGAVGLSVLVSGSWIWRRSGAVAFSWATISVGWGASLSRGLRALLAISLTLVLVRTDIYMLGPMLGVKAVGQISVASTLAEYLWYVPSILSSVLFAAVAASQGPEAIAKLCRASRTTVATLAPVALALLVVGRGLVPIIYGRAYAEAGTLFVLLVPGMFAISLHLVIDSYFAGSGFPPITYTAAGVALLLKIVLNLVAVPRFGLAGAAISTSLVYACLLTVKVIAFRRASGVSLATLLRPSWSDIRYAVGVGRSWVQRFGAAAVDVRA
jgi:O-antigen/teichoic acid export membrane protein